MLVKTFWVLFAKRDLSNFLREFVTKRDNTTLLIFLFIPLFLVTNTFFLNIVFRIHLMDWLISQLDPIYCAIYHLNHRQIKCWVFSLNKTIVWLRNFTFNTTKLILVYLEDDPVSIGYSCYQSFISNIEQLIMMRTMLEHAERISTVKKISF